MSLDSDLSKLKHVYQRTMQRKPSSTWTSCLHFRWSTLVKGQPGKYLVFLNWVSGKKKFTVFTITLVHRSQWSLDIKYFCIVFKYFQQCDDKVFPIQTFLFVHRTRKDWIRQSGVKHFGKTIQEEADVLIWERWCLTLCVWSTYSTCSEVEKATAHA